MKPFVNLSIALTICAALTGCAVVQAKPGGAKVGINPGNALNTSNPKAKAGLALAGFSAGCFWGVESTFREIPGVTATTVGYTGGRTKNPTYEQVCTHTTGHVETVLVEYDPKKVSYKKLLDTFWAWHNPTAVNRQGPDIGDSYRSAIWLYAADQLKVAQTSRDAEQKNWKKPIATTIQKAEAFWVAEEYHQQYDDKTGHRCAPPRNYPIGD